MLKPAVFILDMYGFIFYMLNKNRLYLLFLVIQLVENNFFVPRIQSAYLRIHPAVMVVLLVVGAYIAGFWGLLLVAPLTATVVEIYKYVRRQYQVSRSSQQPE